MGGGRTDVDRPQSEVNPQRTRGKSLKPFFYENVKKGRETHANPEEEGDRHGGKSVQEITIR